MALPVKAPEAVAMATRGPGLPCSGDEPEAEDFLGGACRIGGRLLTPACQSPGLGQQPGPAAWARHVGRASDP